MSEISPNDSNQGYVALWKAVITQALMDAGSNSKKPEMRKSKMQSISWLSGTSEDFELVCAYADLDPDYVREKAGKAIKNGCEWRKYNVNSYTKNRKVKKSYKVKTSKVNKTDTNTNTNFISKYGQKSLNNY